MCVIVYKKTKARIKPRTLREMWDYNPNGAGIAVPEGDKVMIIKGMMDFDDLLATVTEYQSRPMLIHFRMATAGLIDRANTHPFRIGEAAIVHNGILSKYSGDKIRSDTRIFCEDVLSALPEEAWPPLLASVGCKWGIMYPGGGVRLIGGFEKHEGLRVSNGYWKWGNWDPYKSRNWKSRFDWEDEVAESKKAIWDAYDRDMKELF